MTFKKDWISGNKGEWSELYAFYYLMGEPKLYAADEILRKTDDYLPILAAYRSDKTNVEHEYVISDDCCSVQIFLGSEMLDTIPSSDFKERAEFLYNRLQDYKQQKYPDGKKHFPPIPELDDFMQRTFSDRLKAKSSEKKDIQFKVDDAKNARKPLVGFSIKSYVGQNPTLFNAGKNTNFRFEVTKCTKTICDDINSKNGLISKMCCLFESGCDISFVSMLSSNFRMNLELIDSHMDSLLAEVIRYKWKYDLVKISDIINCISEQDPLHKENRNFYAYKMKQFLSSVALGMLPETAWDGRDQANGGYIIVKSDGDVVCYFLYNRNEFNDYLFNCTKIEKPDVERHDYGRIIEDNGRYYIDLDPQIRFILPDEKTDDSEPDFQSHLNDY
ncbi:MAG: HpaII family restriction endonuclease [Candidatus Methanomethylophilaceae archaeon]|nr:HpaII family restriction endonuclease [Candidatus Methanomethylophilaceae archaeon]